MEVEVLTYGAQDERDMIHITGGRIGGSMQW